MPKPKKQKYKKTRTNVYQMITERIIKLLEQQFIPWHRTWINQPSNGHAFNIDAPRSAITNKAYNGINAMLLSAVIMTENYYSPYFITYVEAKKRGGSIKKGVQGYPVVHWQFKLVEDKDKDDGSTKVIPMLHHYTVFNLAQCDNIEIAVPEDLITKAIEREKFSPIERAEKIWAEMPQRPELRHERPSPFYHPHHDYINMPIPESFIDSESYYATLFHEAGHSTGHSSRLNRDTLTTHTVFGSKIYGREELVAEMAAAILCANAGIENQTIDNTVAYLQSWIKAIQEDPKMIVTSAGLAQRAACYILNEQNEDTSPQVDADDNYEADESTIRSA